MDEDQLKLHFRQQEIERRKERRALLLQRVVNEGELLNEELSQAEKIIHDQAIHQMYEQDRRFAESYERNTYGYWRRVWRALTNAK